MFDNSQEELKSDVIQRHKLTIALVARKEHMSQLTTVIFFLIFFTGYSNANEKNSFIKNICEWENKINEPCITISKSLPNSSKFTKTNINKTIISRQDIENSGAVDLVDLLKGIPDVKHY